jgi:hypothetical protein
MSKKVVMKGEGFYVVCPGCGGVYHKTTSAFDSERVANGEMFKLLDTLGPGGSNWTTFPQEDHYKYDSLTCSGCGAPYCDAAGHVRVAPHSAYPDVLDHIIDRELNVEYKELLESGYLLQLQAQRTDLALIQHNNKG